MAKIEQLKQFEETVNQMPRTFDPCKMCKVYQDNNGYETYRIDECKNIIEGKCKSCCWYYDSLFEVNK